MMEKNIMFTLFFMIILSALGNAYDYQQAGWYPYSGIDTPLNYGSVEGIFNTALDDFVIKTRAITTPDLVPLIADLDGDGINEIIVKDGGAIRLYHNNTIEPVDSFNLAYNSYTSNMIVFDVDGDGYLEIIIAHETNERIEFIEYNGTAIFQDYIVSFASSLTHVDGEIMIQCKGEQDCIIILSEYNAGIAGSPAERLFGGSFNTTNAGHSLTLATGNINNPETFCMPSVRSISYADYDNDGDIEYIFSVVGKKTGSSTMRVQIHYVNVSSAGILTEEKQINIDDSTIAPGTLLNCHTMNPGRYISAPLVTDLDGSSSNGLETVVSVMTTPTKFRLYSYLASGSVLVDNDPWYNVFGIVDARALGVSNVFLANAFPDTGVQDFCSVGYYSNTNTMYLLCSSFLTSESSKIWISTYTTPYNMSFTYDSYSLIAHTGRMTTYSDGANNLDEVITPYGVLKMPSSVSILGYGTMDMIFDVSSKGELTLIPADYYDNDASQLIGLSATNIWFWYDSYQNQQAYITEYTVDPCLGSTWKVNTTVDVTVTTADNESNPVSARFVLYAGTSDAIDTNWSAYLPAGSTIPLSVIANVTKSSASLIIYVKDNVSEEAIYTITNDIAVNVNGVENGDCTSTVSGLTATGTETGGTSGVVDTDLDDNALTNGINEFANMSNLSTLIIWLIVMVAVIMGIISSNTNNSIKTFVVVLATVIMIIIGALLEIIPIGIIILIAIVGLATIGLFIRKFVTGTG